MSGAKFGAYDLIPIAVAAVLVSAVPYSSALSASPDGAQTQAQAQESWRETIVRTDVPGEGCFSAAYPSVTWLKVSCTVAPNLPYLPRGRTAAQTVGNGVDYVAETLKLTSRSVGTFPTVTGVKSENDGGKANDYSLQLNSNFMTTAVCNGHSGCQSWQQFVYSSGYQVAFMQYWLINYGNTCPSGWMSYSGDCYKNSAAVSVSAGTPITQLAKLKLSGNSVKNGKDTLIFTTGTTAHSTSGKDSVVDLATGWNQSEFNVIGDGNGSQAVFNKGASITVKISVTDGTTKAPTCVADGGTTAETNNLTLKGCTTFGGKAPAIEFTEAN